MSRAVCISIVLVGGLQSVLFSQTSPLENAAPIAWEELTSKAPWVFLGDSNTYAGGYVAILDAWLRESQPSVRVLNMGVSSETASGLSEIDHPFKRPCVHERLSKTLTMTRAKVVFACYGMNDGIYDPPSSERLEAYKAGMKQLADQVHASGAIFICLTPPIFEPEPVSKAGKFGPADTGRYAFFAPYQRYDDVLVEQAAWCLKNEMGADAVIDIRSPLLVSKEQHLSFDAAFSYSKDGVHFGSEAHEVVAKTIMASLRAPQALLDSYPSPEQIETALSRMKLLRNAYLSASGKNRPGLPAGEPVWYAEKLVELELDTP